MNHEVNKMAIIVPEVIDVYEKRYKVLKEICNNRVIGRRKLSEKLNMSERTIRGIAQILKKQGLICIESYGMQATNIGRYVIDSNDG